MSALRPRTVRLRAGLAAVLVVVAACGPDAPTRPASESGPGTLELKLVGPNGPEGAAHLQVIGDGVRSIGAVSGRLFADPVTNDTIDVVLVRQDAGDLILRLSLADTLAVPTVRVLDVAGPDYASRNPSAYSVEVVR